MDANVKTGQQMQTVRLDWYTLIQDVIKEWQVIIMISVAAFLFSFSWQYLHYSPTYTMSVTFTVSSKGAMTDIYTNLSSASNTASEFTQILNSSFLQGKVAEEIGMDYMPGTVTAEVIENTNLMELKVVENTPKQAYDVLYAILNNYDKVSNSLMGDVVLNLLVKPEIPVEPDVSFSPLGNMCKAFFEAMVVIILLIGAASFFKDTVRREGEVENKLDTKLLGTLCHENKYHTWKGRMKKSKQSILFSDPMVSFRYSESMKKLASKIAGKMKKRHAKVVLVTSVLENEGKSTVAANLALALKEESSKVLLIDGDFRKPALYKIFRIHPEDVENLGEALNGKSDMNHLICRKKGMDLSMILNTIRYPDSTDMISQDLMGQILKYLKKHYDYIIVDSSPMALVADTQELMNVVDAAILVVRQHMASVRDINDSIDALNRNEIKLLGCIFNDVGGENSRFSYGGYGRYGKYNNYGHYGNYSRNYGSYEYEAMREKRSEEDE